MIKNWTCILCLIWKQANLHLWNEDNFRIIFALPRFVLVRSLTPEIEGTSIKWTPEIVLWVGGCQGASTVVARIVLWHLLRSYNCTKCVCDVCHCTHTCSVLASANASYKLNGLNHWKPLIILFTNDVVWATPMTWLAVVYSLTSYI